MQKIWDIFEEEKEKKKSSVWNMFEVTDETTTMPTEPTQFGIGAKAVGGATLTKPPEVPSSQFGISDLTSGKVSPEQKQIETLSLKMKELDTRKEQESFCYEILTGEKVDDIFTLPLEERKKALSLMTELQRTAVTTTEKFNETVGKIGWVGAIGIMGAQTVAGFIKITPDIWRKLNVKIIDKKISFKEGLDAVLKVGHGEGTSYQRKIFDAVVKQADSNNISVVNMLKKGLTITEAQPRFAFGTKLYAGLPADEIVNAIVEVGKVTTEMVKGLDPAKIPQITQQLLNIEPALANEFSKAIEKAETEAPEVEIPKGINDLKKELAGRMTEKRVFLDEIEKALGKKLDMDKSEDIQTALDYIKKPEISQAKLTKEKFTEAMQERIDKETQIPAEEAEPTPEEIRGVFKAKPTSKPVIEIKPEKVEPKIGLATSAQIKEAHILAREHKLIVKTPSGKMSNLRYKRLAKNFTGKTSIKDMTQEEADEFIEAIKSVVQRKPWEPPIIPLSTKIVPKEFFEMEFKEPDISKIITPKKYYLRILGAEPLLKDLIDSFELLSLKRTEINKWVSDIIKKINKEAMITHKFKAMVYNRPTDQVATMRDLLDKHENPPDFLKPKEKEIFKEVRDFTKDMLIKTNEVRDRVGLDPIEDIKTYIPHFLDELAKQIVNKRYPFPEDVKYWLGRNMPKKIYNPTAMERQVKDDLKDFFSKDLGALLRTLAKYDLRDIYLSEPYSILKAELNALGDKIPARLRTEMDLFLKHDIFNYPTELDLMLNKTLEKPTDVINFFLKPFNRIVSNPISSLSNVFRQGLMGGAIALKPRLVLRNTLTQKLLNMNIYPIKDYLRAQFWKTPKGVMEKIRDTTFYKLSVRKFEDLPPLLKPVQWGMYPYSKSHAGINYISNVDVSGKVGYYYGEDMIAWCDTPKGKAYIEKYAKKHNLTGKAKNDLTWREGDEIEEAVEAMSVTQWLYFSTDMPRVFRGKGARAFWSLQSWYMNWFGKHLREGLIRMGGKTSRGRIVRPGDRVNLIKGLVVILALTEAVKRTTGIDMRRFLFFPFPAYIYPPAMQLILNTYYLVTANTEQKRKKAINGLKNNLKLLIPFSGAWKRYWQFIKGELTLKEWLFYMEKKEEAKKRKAIPKSDVWGEVEGKEEKSDVWGTFDTESKKGKSSVWDEF